VFRVLLILEEDMGMGGMSKCQAIRICKDGCAATDPMQHLVCADVIRRDMQWVIYSGAAHMDG